MRNISVIVTSYNQYDTLREAIDSVIGQTLPAYEIIVCDDASTDDSKRLIRTYEAKFCNNVRGVYHKKNIGVAKNRNSGLELAGGDFVTWLDGDDIFLPQKLELEASRLSDTASVKWVYSQVIEFNATLQTRRQRYRKPLDGMIFDKVISVLGKAPRNPLVDRTSLKRIGYFDENLSMYEDFDLCLRLARAYPCSFQARPAMEYRYNPAGLSSKGIQHHWSNVQRLQHNLLQYTQDLSKRKKKCLVSRFLTNEKVVYFTLASNYDAQRKLGAVRYITWACCHNPVLLSKSILYRTLASVLLPVGLKARLKHFKETVFG